MTRAACPCGWERTGSHSAVWKAALEHELDEHDGREIVLVFDEGEQ